MTRAQEPAESGDCTGCRHYHFIPEQRGIGGRKSAGEGCLLTGGHAIKRCASYQTQEPAELRPGLPPVELRRVHARWVDENGNIIQFSTHGDFFDWVRSDGMDYTDEMWHRVDVIQSCFVTSFSPLGSTWAAVEALAAKAAEVR